MKEFRIEFKQRAQKALRRIPNNVLFRIQKAILDLRSDPLPVGSEKMRGYDGYYRIRVSTYRIVYQVESTNRMIIIIQVGHRKNVYKQL